MKKYFLNDSECEFMKDKGCVSPGYNVQAAIDEKNKLIVKVYGQIVKNLKHSLNVCRIRKIRYIL